jgi:cytochrome c oxidase subunit 4
MTEPAVPRKTYLFTWLSLLSLTLLTTLIGFLDLGAFSMVLAVAFAVAKASLIVLFFMHALYEFRLVLAIIGAGIIWLFILIGLTLTDYLSRGWLPFPGK